MSKLALLCSGQGAQSPDLFSRFPFTEKGLALRRRVLDASCLDPEAAAWLADPASAPEAIYQNRLSQPLICLFQAMVWAELEAVLPKPEVIAGYSLGELSAYGCAGALASEEVVRLAGIRAHAMDAACPHGALLAVTGLPVEAAEAAARRVECYLAIVVAEDHCVLGGPADRVAALTEAVRVAGSLNITPLAVTVASHTPLLDDAVEPFREALRAVAWSAPCAPVLAGINAVKVLRREQMEEWLPEQMHRTVRWDRILQRLAESDCHVLLELGPGRQLSHMAVAQGLEARSVEEFRSAEGVRVWVEKCLTRGA